jgi:large subunit ribosomal protein L30
MDKASKTSKGSKKGGSKLKLKLKLKLVRSVIGTTRYQREVVQGLGLRRLHQTIERSDTPEIRGMLAKVVHLVEIVES